jgi:23S rRNA pseudouridine1911/1915/1917 synthase
MRPTAGATVHIDPRRTSRRASAEALPASALIHVDREIVVVDKPVGISTVPFDASEHDTLIHRVRTALSRHEGRSGPPLRVVQRLDKDTSGVLVFARTKRAERHVGQQIRSRTATRRYVGLAYGRVTGATLETTLVADRGDGLRGSWNSRKPGRPPSGAKRAVTHIEPLECLAVPPELQTQAAAPAWVTLVACRLETGRQHQIRIHLAELGHPLVGERVYVRDYRGAYLPGFVPGQGRPMLHAQLLGFEHPATQRPVVFERDPPPDFAAVLETLRGHPTG